MIKFDHAVKFNGKYYPAGAEIPEPVEVEAAEEQPEAPEKSTKRRKKGDA